MSEQTGNSHQWILKKGKLSYQDIHIFYSWRLYVYSILESIGSLRLSSEEVLSSRGVGPRRNGDAPEFSYSTQGKTAHSSRRSLCFSAQRMHHLRCSFHSTTITPHTSRERKTSLRLTMSQRNSSTPHQSYQIGCAAAAQLQLKYGDCLCHYPAPKTGCWGGVRCLKVMGGFARVMACVRTCA